jgi:lysophospholipid acyltransferase (LPLAT)-like uncharacterized protein
MAQPETVALQDTTSQDLPRARARRRSDAPSPEPLRSAKKRRKKRSGLAKKSLQVIAPWIAAPLLFLLSRTWRVRVIGDPKGCAYVHTRGRPPCTFALWHSDDLTLGSLYAYSRLGIIISRSSDGELIARTLRLLGFSVFRGSSSRGGAEGLLGVIRHVREGHPACLTVDGPRGPLHKVKPGIVEIARKTGEPVVPISAFASRAWRFHKSWNKTFLPKPFATVTVVCSAPLFAGKSATARTGDVQLVQDALDDIGRVARSQGVPGAA